MPVSDETQPLAESAPPLPKLDGITEQEAFAAKNDRLARIACETGVGGAVALSSGFTVLAFSNHLFPKGKAVHSAVDQISVVVFVMGGLALALGFLMAILRYKTRRGRFALLAPLIPVSTFIVVILVEGIVFHWK